MGTSKMTEIEFTVELIGITEITREVEDWAHEYYPYGILYSKGNTVYIDCKKSIPEN